MKSYEFCVLSFKFSDLKNGENNFPLEISSAPFSNQPAGWQVFKLSNFQICLQK